MYPTMGMQIISLRLVLRNAWSTQLLPELKLLLLKFLTLSLIMIIDHGDVENQKCQ
jgi:hypothetical protein